MLTHSGQCAGSHLSIKKQHILMMSYFIRSVGKMQCFKVKLCTLRVLLQTLRVEFLLKFWLKWFLRDEDDLSQDPL